MEMLSRFTAQRLGIMAYSLLHWTAFLSLLLSMAPRQPMSRDGRTCWSVMLLQIHFPCLTSCTQYYSGGLSTGMHNMTVTNVDPTGLFLDLDKIVVSTWPAADSVSSISSSAAATATSSAPVSSAKYVALSIETSARMLMTETSDRIRPSLSAASCHRW